MPRIKAFTILLLPLDTNFALLKISALVFELPPAHGLACKQTCGTIEDHLVTINATSFIELFLKIHETIWKLV